ncbi:MAG: SusC/RagA family TonB-linked outer membrane protein, partial [Bacteroidetes bacterium]|nr:SusC/RagA family TonB-linked outer membrane protein [Bacteroidota bacterium]
MKTLYRGLALIILVFAFNLSAFSQTITGKIIDEEGIELPGVSIYVEGTTIGTTSDIFGAYTLIIKQGELAGDSLTIIYSFISFTSRKFQIPVNPGATMTHDVVLLEEVEMLQEVVVVGYGVQKKSDITGAISTIKPQEITRLPVTSIDQVLQGKAAGVQVSQTSGAPGESIKVRIRGLGTINNNDPLYIIDGVPTKDVTGILNSEDIESMTILKDAASAAIYGARAGNGVIIIKTKKGQAGKTRFSFNTYAGIQTHGRLTPMCNTDQYINIYNEAALADDREPIPDDIRPQLSNTNWLEEIFRPAVMQNYQLTISGGDKKSSFLIGGGYQSQQGIILNSDYERLNFRTSINTELAEWANVGSNLTFSYSNRDIIGASGDGYGGNGGSVIRYAFFRTPPVPVYESNGEYSDLPMFEGYDRAKLNTWFGDGYNPVGLADKYDWYAKTYRLFGNFFADFKITEGLKFRSDFGINMSFLDEKRFNENWGTDDRINSPNSMTKGVGTAFTWNWTNTLNYVKTFNEKHNTSFLLGVEAIKNNFHEQIGSDRDFADQSPNLRYLGNGLSLYKGADERQTGWSLLSGFARVNYNFNNKYIIEGVVRTDGSSRFTPENRWGVFYSGSIGWSMHNENFLSNVDWLSQLKPRLSVGQSGNQEIGLYNYASIIESGYNYPLGGFPNNGYAVSSFGNINTTWETTTTYDIGLDMAFLDNRLTLITDYYWRYTDDMLIPVPLPPSGGSADPPFVNAGKVLNRGFEVEIFWREIKENFKYEVGGNFSTLYNEVLSLSGGRPIPAGRIDNGVFATLTEEGH